MTFSIFLFSLMVPYLNKHFLFFQVNRCFLLHMKTFINAFIPVDYPGFKRNQSKNIQKITRCVFSHLIFIFHPKNFKRKKPYECMTFSLLASQISLSLHILSGISYSTQYAKVLYNKPQGCRKECQLTLDLNLVNVF